MRLIDADALKAEWYRLNDINEEDCGARFVGYQEIARLINNAPTVQPTGDVISRADAIGAVMKHKMPFSIQQEVAREIDALPSADAVQGEWIPCSKKMPKELERVNVTWLNHNPPFYYQHIKDIPQIDTAVYYRGKWYWWDATVIDILAEYGEDCNAEQIDKDIEVVAWMPLPKPYKGGDSDE